MNAECRRVPENPAVKVRSKDLEATHRIGDVASDLLFLSGRRDLNPRPLDPQDCGSEVTPAQSVFFVRACYSLTCGLFSV
jgi:hypothetical protein